jgi:hypothetical protein
LKELGLTKQESHRAQLIATIPKVKLDRWLASCMAEGRVPTFAAARDYALQMAGKKPRARGRSAAHATDDDALGEISEHQRMLQQLLDRVGDGEVLEFTEVESRYFRRVVDEIGKLSRHGAE